MYVFISLSIFIKIINHCKKGFELCIFVLESLTLLIKSDLIILWRRKRDNAILEISSFSDPTTKINAILEISSFSDPTTKKGGGAKQYEVGPLSRKKLRDTFSLYYIIM